MQRKQDTSVYRAKGENAIKIYLMGYRSLLRRQEALMAALTEYRERATRATSRITATNISGTRSRGPLETNAIQAVDGERKLQETIGCMGEELANRLEMIEGLKEERHKEIITMRYITGMGWENIVRKVPYERTQIFEIHGKALQEMEKWKKEKERTKTD